MVRQIALSQGLFALVDDDDYHLVAGHAWYAQKGAENWYARTIDGKSMHRVITDAPVGKEVDHANGNGLDNRRANLRVCTRAENAKNRAKHAPAVSKFKGVHLTKFGWRAAITQNGEKLNLGTFKSEERAARQYDRAARLCFGKFARTNEAMGLLKPRVAV